MFNVGSHSYSGVEEVDFDFSYGVFGQINVLFKKVLLEFAEAKHFDSLSAECDVSLPVDIALTQSEIRYQRLY